MKWQSTFVSKGLFGTMLFTAVVLSGSLPATAAQDRITPIQISASDPRLLVRDWINVLNGSQKSPGFNGLDSSAKSSLLHNKRKSALISIGNPIYFEIQGKSISKQKIITYIYVRHSYGNSLWWIGYNTSTNRITNISYKVNKVHAFEGLSTAQREGLSTAQRLEPSGSIVGGILSSRIVSRRKTDSYRRARVKWHNLGSNLRRIASRRNRGEPAGGRGNSGADTDCRRARAAASRRGACGTVSYRRERECVRFFCRSLQSSSNLSREHRRVFFRNHEEN